MDGQTEGHFCYSNTSYAATLDNNLGWRLSVITDNARETSHLFQCVSILIQRYNAVAFRGSFVEEDDNVSS